MLVRLVSRGYLHIVEGIWHYDRVEQQPTDKDQRRVAKKTGQGGKEPTPSARRLVRGPREAPAAVKDFGTIVRRQARRIRSAQGLTVDQLAARCEELGLTDFNSTLITAIEIGRKKSVTVNEWIQLAAALNVAPIHLLVPMDSDQETWVGEKRSYPAADVRRWVQGSMPLDFTNSRTYFTQAPEEQWAEFTQQAQAAASAPPGRRRRKETNSGT